MLVIGKNTTVPLSEDVLRRSYSRFVQGIRVMLQNLQDDATKLQNDPEALKKVFNSEIPLRMQIALMVNGTLSREIVKVLKQDDVIEGTNQLFQNIISETVNTHQPAEHLEKMMDMAGSTYIDSGVAAEGDVEKSVAIIKALTEIMTTGAPTTAATASLNGATIPQLKMMEDEMVKYRGVMMKMIDTLFAKPEMPAPEAAL